MASAYYPYVQVACQARASLSLDGMAIVCSAATDIGPGTYTVMTQVPPAPWGCRWNQYKFELGDTGMPPAPLQGGSGLTAALGSAVHDACRQLLRAFVELAARDNDSPLRGCSLQDVTVARPPQRNPRRRPGGR